MLVCECPIHRYEYAHICSCKEVITHSQADWGRHRSHDMLDFPSEVYRHGDTVEEVVDRVFGYGMCIAQDHYVKVYNLFAEDLGREFKTGRG